VKNSRLVLPCGNQADAADQDHAIELGRLEQHVDGQVEVALAVQDEARAISADLEPCVEQPRRDVVDAHVRLADGLRGYDAHRRADVHQHSVAQFDGVVEQTVKFGFIKLNALYHFRSLPARIVFLEQRFHPSEVAAAKFGRGFDCRLTIQCQPGQDEASRQQAKQQSPDKCATHFNWAGCA